MLRVRAALATLLVCGYGIAGDAVPKEEYRSRREALRKFLPDGVIVLFGRTEADAADSRSGFIQEPNFYYLTGWREPGAILLLAPHKTEILFLPAHFLNADTGFENVQAASRFEAELSSLRSRYPQCDVADARQAIGRLRLKKSPAEVALIRKSIDVSIEAHRAAWKRIRPGLYEYQIAATMAGSWLERGCERSAYSPIIASGPNATILHYFTNSRRMERGDLLVVDAGAECSGYAADITRTLPVDGKFTPRQRELYEIVLGAQKEVFAAVRPGVTFDRGAANGLTQIALDYINSRGKDREGKPLGQYLPHKVGHHVGLEVHDAGAMLTYGPLEAGMVITIEPGLYIPDEGVGIRIEDMLLVTESGAKVLTEALPKEPAEIERALAR